MLAIDVEPPAKNPSRPLTPRDASRWAGVVLSILVALPIYVGLAGNSLVHDRIRRVNEVGGLVASDADFTASSTMLSRAPEWLQRLYVIRSGYKVYFGTPPMSCVGPGESLAMFPPVTPRPGVMGDPGDHGLSELRALGNVVWLSLRDTSVSDAGLLHIGHLRSLADLDLEGTRVTGPGLSHLHGLPSSRLSLARTAIDDGGLAHLDGLPALSTLSLRHTKIEGPGLATLARFGALADLDLSETPVGDAALAHLEGLPIVDLHLLGTAVTDAGLAHIARMPRVQTINLCATRVTNEGVLELRKALRRTVEIHHGRYMCP